nr:toxic anion resistance protein [Clostridia bacterium]
MENDTNSLPMLTLDPGSADTAVIQPPEVIAQTALKEVEAAAPLEEAKLSEAEQKLVAEFSKQIDLTNSAQILKYGSAAQEKVASFADTALENVKTKELGEVGEMILDLVGELKEFRPEEEKKGLARLFGKKSNKLEVLKGRYDKAADSVEKMCVMLEEHQRVLLKDIALLDKLYEVNLTNFKELSLYIVAGKRKLKEARETDLAAFTEKARQSGLPEDAQAASD